MNYSDYTDCSLRLAVDLTNSGGEGDPLADAAALTGWLSARTFSGPVQPTEGDVEGLRRLRERLRSVFVSPDAGGAARIVNDLLATSAALPQLTDHDGEPWHLHFTPVGATLLDRITAETAMALAALVAGGGLDRLRVCAHETCEDVFVDASRNRSRRFCNPATCGNRAHVAAYRARQRARAEDR